MEAKRFFLTPWWWVQRRMDMRMLWPICRQFSRDINEARDAFLVHAIITPCWIEYYGEQALHARVKELT